MYHTEGTITKAARDNLINSDNVNLEDLLAFLQDPYNFKSFKKILLDNLERVYPELKNTLGREEFRKKASALANDGEIGSRSEFEENVIGKLADLLNKTDPKDSGWRKNVVDWISRGIGGSFSAAISTCFALKLTVDQTNDFLAKANLGPLTANIADDVIYMYWLTKNAEETPDEEREFAKNNLEQARNWIRDYQQDYSADPEAITTRDLKEAIDFSLDPELFHTTYLIGGKLPPYCANEAAWNILIEQMDRAKLTLINQNLDKKIILTKIKNLLNDKDTVSVLRLADETRKNLNEAITEQLNFGGQVITIRVLWNKVCEQASGDPNGLRILTNSILGKLTDFMSLVFPGKPLNAKNPFDTADDEINIAELFELFPDDRNLKPKNLKSSYIEIDSVKKAQKARHYTPIRKGIILFYFINYYFENGDDILKKIKECPDDATYETIREDYRKNINNLLESCQLPAMYDANQFDYLILKSIYQYYNSIRGASGNEDEELENPYEFFTSVIAEAYDNAAQGYDL